MVVLKRGRISNIPLLRQIWTCSFLDLQLQYIYVPSSTTPSVKKKIILKRDVTSYYNEFEQSFIQICDTSQERLYPLLGYFFFGDRQSRFLYIGTEAIASSRFSDAITREDRQIFKVQFYLIYNSLFIFFHKYNYVVYAYSLPYVSVNIYRSSSTAKYICIQHMHACI